MGFSLEDVDETLEAVAGDKVLGTLDHGLKVQYVELAEIETELMDRTDELRKSTIGTISNRLMEEWDGTPDFDRLRELGEMAAFPSASEAYDYFELVARWQEANSSFWYRCKLTFKAFNDTCSIRQGYTVVTLGKKYRQ